MAVIALFLSHLSASAARRQGISPVDRGLTKRTEHRPTEYIGNDRSRLTLTRDRSSDEFEIDLGGGWLVELGAPDTE